MSYKHRTKCDACIEFISGKIETNKMASKIFCLGHDSWRGKWKPLYASYSTFLSLCLSISHFRHVYYLDWIIIIIPIQWSLPFPFSCSWIPCPAGSIAVAPFFVQIVHLMAFWMPKIDWQRMHALYADNLTIFRVWDLDHHLPCHCYGHRHKTDCYPFITNITNKHAHSKFTRSLRLEFRQFAMLIISNPFQKLNYIKLMTVYGFSFIFVCCATTEWQFWANVSFTLTHFTSLRFRILLRSFSLALRLCPSVRSIPCSHEIPVQRKFKQPIALCVGEKNYSQTLSLCFYSFYCKQIMPDFCQVSKFYRFFIYF